MKIFMQNWYTKTGDEIAAFLVNRVYEIWNVDEDQLLYRSSCYDRILSKAKEILAEAQEAVIG